MAASSLSVTLNTKRPSDWPPFEPDWPDTDGFGKSSRCAVPSAGLVTCRTEDHSLCRYTSRTPGMEHSRMTDCKARAAFLHETLRITSDHVLCHLHKSNVATLAQQVKTALDAQRYVMATDTTEKTSCLWARRVFRSCFSRPRAGSPCRQPA